MALQTDFTTSRTPVNPMDAFRDVFGARGSFAQSLMARDAKIAKQRAEELDAKKTAENQAFQLQLNQNNIEAANSRLTAQNQHAVDMFNKEQTAINNREWAKDDATAQANALAARLNGINRTTTTETVAPVKDANGNVVRELLDTPQTQALYDNVGQEYLEKQLEAEKAGYVLDDKGNYVLPSQDALQLAYNKANGLGNKTGKQEIVDKVKKDGPGMLKHVLFETNPINELRLMTTKPLADKIDGYLDSTENERLQKAANPTQKPAATGFEKFTADEQAKVDALNSSLAKIRTNYDAKNVASMDSFGKTKTEKKTATSTLSDTEYAAKVKEVKAQFIADYKASHNGKAPSTKARGAMDAKANDIVSKYKDALVASQSKNAEFQQKVSLLDRKAQLDAMMANATGEQKQKYAIELEALKAQIKKQALLDEQVLKHNIDNSNNWFGSTDINFQVQ
jgi:uncharacterized protein YdcH (DUF465 family)